MSFEVRNMIPENDWDVVMMVIEHPWNPWSEDKYHRFIGSGSIWHEVVKDRFNEYKKERCGMWMSGILHDLWNEQLNLQLERKNCKR